MFMLTVATWNGDIPRLDCSIQLHGRDLTGCLGALAPYDYLVLLAPDPVSHVLRESQSKRTLEI